MSFSLKKESLEISYSYWPFYIDLYLYKFQSSVTPGKSLKKTEYSFIYFCFLGPYSKHMEVPSQGQGSHLSHRSDSAGSLTPRPPGNSQVGGSIWSVWLVWGNCMGRDTDDNPGGFIIGDSHNRLHWTWKWSLNKSHFLALFTNSVWINI